MAAPNAEEKQKCVKRKTRIYSMLTKILEIHTFTHTNILLPDPANIPTGIPNGATRFLQMHAGVAKIF